MKKADDNKIWILISLKLSNEASDQDLQALEELIKQKPALAQILEVLEKCWTENPRDAANTFDLFFEKLKKKL